MVVYIECLVLIVLALVKKFPDRHFLKTHRLLLLVYLLPVFHSPVLMKFVGWGSAVAPVTATLATFGRIAAVSSLLGRVGYKRRAVGEIERLEYHQDSRVLKIAIGPESKWVGHQEGPFAFVTFDKREGDHPFTITSPWKGDGIVSFYRFPIPDLSRHRMKG